MVLDIFTEPSLNPDTLGVPVVIVDGLRQIRASGMMPHANIFGGLMAVGVGLVTFLSIRSKVWWLMIPRALP